MIKKNIPDLIIHIGFPKCASSTLQEAFFIDEIGYLSAFRVKPIKANTPVSSEPAQKQDQGCGVIFQESKSGTIGIVD